MRKLLSRISRGPVSSSAKAGTAASRRKGRAGGRRRSWAWRLRDGGPLSRRPGAQRRGLSHAKPEGVIPPCGFAGQRVQCPRTRGTKRTGRISWTALCPEGFFSSRTSCCGPGRLERNDEPPSGAELLDEVGGNRLGGRGDEDGSRTAPPRATPSGRRPPGSTRPGCRAGSRVARSAGARARGSDLDRHRPPPPGGRAPPPGSRSRCRSRERGAPAGWPRGSVIRATM